MAIGREKWNISNKLTKFHWKFHSQEVFFLPIIIDIVFMRCFCWWNKFLSNFIVHCSGISALYSLPTSNLLVAFVESGKSTKWKLCKYLFNEKSIKLGCLVVGSSIFEILICNDILRNPRDSLQNNEKFVKKKKKERKKIMKICKKNGKRAQN